MNAICVLNSDFRSAFYYTQIGLYNWLQYVKFIVMNYDHIIIIVVIVMNW